VRPSVHQRHGVHQVLPHEVQEAGERLERLITELGVILATIITGGAAEETGGDWKETVSKYHIRHKLTEQYSPWQNQTKLEIRELKKSIRCLLASMGAPVRLWCYAGEWIAQIWRHTVHDLMALDERTPVEHFAGQASPVTLRRSARSAFTTTAGIGCR
jgi:hypothetical protein